MTINLNTLIEKWKSINPEFSFENTKDLAISGIEVDSRKVQDGYIFVAVKGYKTDGHQFIKSAIEKGASCIIIEKEELDNTKPLIENKDIILIPYNNTRKALAIVSKIFYDDPSSKLKLIGVTGTNGKTTITYMIREVLHYSNIKTGLIGTISNYIDNEKIPSPVTTPDALELNRLFYRMVEKQIEYVIMEVSSHALYLDRVYGLDFDAAIFTNLSEDHLDFHSDMDDYLNAKLLFLDRLAESKKQNKLILINGDSPAGNNFIDKAKKLNLNYKSYGIEKPHDILAKDIQFDIAKSQFSIKMNGDNTALSIHMPGKFNVYNALSAYGVVKFFNLTEEKIQKGLNQTSVPGRFQVIPSEKGAFFIIDYAHTDDALENVLKTIKDLKPKRIITVFGCGGDRDKGKRPLMGAVSATLSDYSIVTSDNPRTEDPDSILEDIIVGVKENNGDYIAIVSRYDAIKKAAEMSEKDDVILIAGKGHEDYQILKDKTIHFDDKETVENLLKIN